MAFKSSTKNKPICLATDWSKTGIGFWLLQKHCSCTRITPICCTEGWKTTLVGSRFTHAAEFRYAPIEGEALVVADALDKTRFFVLGCRNLVIAVDHKPLLKVLGDRSLNDISNARLRNLKEKTLRYRFTMIHIPGVKHKAADTLSRHPTGSATPAMLQLPDDVAKASDHCSRFDLGPLLNRPREDPNTEANDDDLTSHAMAALDSLQPQGITWNKVRVSTSSDENLQNLLNIIESGFPKKRDALPPPLREFHRFREHLSTVDGVIMYKDRIMIPRSLRQSVLLTLHSAHQGETAMLSRANSTVF